jgi:hypothetical protein
MVVVRPGQLVPRDPDAVQVLAFDHAADVPALAPVDAILRPRLPVAIINSVWRVSGPDASLTIDAASIVDTTTTAIRVAGGTLNRTYRLENVVSFNCQPSRTAAASFRLLVQQS